MTFTICTEQGDDHNLYSLNELSWAVDRLDSEPGSFLCVVPETPINAITYMQAAFIEKTKGLFKKTIVASFFLLEVQEEKPNGDLIQHTCTTEQKEIVMQAFEDFVEAQRLPDFTEWEHELFYKHD